MTQGEFEFVRELLAKNAVLAIESFMRDFVTPMKKGTRNVTITHQQDPMRFTITVKIGEKYIVGSGPDLKGALLGIAQSALIVGGNE